MNEALIRLGYDYDYEIIVSLKDIIEYGVSKTPALVVNGKVVFEGKVPSIIEMPDILEEAFNNLK